VSETSIEVSVRIALVIALVGTLGTTLETYISGPISSKEIVFTSESFENMPSGGRARETYQIASPDELVEVFELAEPGKEFAMSRGDHGQPTG
jgi:hypothetical protein